MSEIPNVKVVVADDNKLSQIVLKKKLQAAGAVVDVAGNGAEVMSLMAKEVYDVVILDLYMPEMDGIETLRAIRSLPENEKKSVPVIACTASNMPGEEVDGAGVSFDAVTGKPVDIDQMISLIKKFTS